ncbi:MAG: hypothetical protein ABI600_17860, partial [Luteolibacter sp.]
DGRLAAEIEELKKQGIYAVPAYSVEALYYHPEIQRRVSERHATVTGADSHTQLTNAQSAALTAINGHADRMSKRVAEKAIRAEVFGQIPGKVEVNAGLPLHINIDIAGAVATERARFDVSFAASDLEALVARYPIRETPALSQIAAQLGFQDRNQYESAVQKLLIDDTTAVTFMRSLFGTLWQDIAAP